MTAEEKRYLAEVVEFIDRLVETHAYKPSDFNENGYLTDEADSRVGSAIMEMLPEKARQVLRKHAEEQVNAALEALIEEGRVERIVSETGIPMYRCDRDFDRRGDEI